MGDEVHEYQGREPSGRKFGEICLDPKSKYLNTLKYTILDFDWNIPSI